MEEQRLVDPMIRIRVLESVVGSNAIAIAQQAAMIEHLSLENQRLVQDRDSLQVRLVEYETEETPESDKAIG